MNDVELVEAIGTKGLIPTMMLDRVDEVWEGEDALRVRRQEARQKSIPSPYMHLARFIGACSEISLSCHVLGCSF